MPPPLSQSARSSDLIRVTDRGLYCEAGDFWIDPWKPVPKALVTHGHADHTRPGMGSYLCARPGERLVQRRVAPDARVMSVDYGEKVRLGDTEVSFHPAGHVLGSAQIRVEHRGRVWVASGDYKTAPDPTCAPIEPVRCETFITESTFGLPIFRWQDPGEVGAEILEWWAANAREGCTTALFAYALGKAQRLLAEIARAADGDLPGEIAVHGAVDKLLEVYRFDPSMELPPTRYASPEVAAEISGSGLVVAPPSANGTPWMRKFKNPRTGFASGWMRMRGPRRRRNFDRGFILSDHADWSGLLATIEATEAERVLVTHGYVDPLVRWLRSQGKEAAPLAAPFAGEEGAVEEGAAEEPS